MLRRSRIAILALGVLEAGFALRARAQASTAPPAPGPSAIQVPEAERALVEPYVRVLVSEAWSELEGRWRSGLPRPPAIALYESTDGFARATGGAPPDGVQGLLLDGDRGIVLLSPKGGALAWGRTLWHEMAHVVHREISRGRAPRWFLEGLAELDASEARPWWRLRSAPRVRAALAARKLSRLRELEDELGGQPPAGALEALYAQSAYAVERIVARHGRDAARAMLVAWGSGKRTERVVREVLGTSLADLDAGLRAEFDADGRAHEPARYAALLARATDASAHGDRNAALGFLEQAARLDPERVDAWGEMLKLGRSMRDEALTDRAVERISALDPYGRDALGYLLPVLVRAARWRELGEAAWALVAIDPARPDAHYFLGRAKLETGDPAAALGEIELAVKLGVPAQSGARGDLERAKRELGLRERKGASTRPGGSAVGTPAASPSR